MVDERGSEPTGEDDVRTRQRDLNGVGARSTVEDFWLPTGVGATGASWFWPDGRAADLRRDVEPIGVLIVPGITHEEQTMAVGLVALARELADSGMPTLLIDLAGTAHGTGDLSDPDIGHRWDDDVRSAVRHMRDSGIRHVVVVGVRLGALVAAHATVDDPVDLMVMWAPVLSGRRYVREMQMMQASATETVRATLPGITVAGFNLPPALVDHLRQLDAAKLDGKPASRLCIVDSAERLDALDAEHPLVAAVPVDRVQVVDTDQWLFTSAEDHPAPFADIATVRDRIDALAPRVREAGACVPAQPDLGDRRTNEFDHDGAPICEERVRFGHEMFGDAGSLSGIQSGPADGFHDPGRTPAYVAVTGVGPGRIFVDFARREAAAGRVCLRFELSGFGTSTRRPHGGWADFYQPTAQADIAAAVDVLVAAGHSEVHVVGFCAGAWSAIQMTPRPSVAGIVAINPQLVVRTRLLHRRPWPDLSMRRRALARIAQIDVVRRAVEKAEREWPVPSPALRWVGRHSAAGTAVRLMFADDDLGRTYFDSRARRPFGIGRRGRRLELHVYDDLGHLPSGEVRDRMLADIHRLVG